jgi:hypothetical protein
MRPAPTLLFIKSTSVKSPRAGQAVGQLSRFGVDRMNPDRRPKPTPNCPGTCVPLHQKIGSTNCDFKDFQNR